jgi:short-subunit dehydrogenase
MDLDNKGALVTGASRGLGKFIARALAAHGARLVLAARSAKELEEVAAEIRAAGGKAAVVPADVSKLPDLEALVAAADEELGGIDILVNNAGIETVGMFHELPIEEMRRILEVNLISTMILTRLVLPGMVERQRGHIVNIASLAGRFATPGAAVYGATKHAVVAFSEALYHELGPRGILVTSVNPGFSPTEGFPETGPSFVRLDPDDVAKLIVDVVQKGTAPEISIPRSLAALQAFRVLTPPLYRWGVGTISRRYPSTEG